MLVYLDNAATTQVCPQAARAALEVMTEGFGNPSSRCAWGGRAAARLKEDRQTVADALGCAPEELFFTSCGTEGDNWAIRGGGAVQPAQGKAHRHHRHRARRRAGAHPGAGGAGL